MTRGLDPSQPPDAQCDKSNLSDVETLELLRRSPHPYHRRKADIQLTTGSNDSAADESPQSSLSVPGTSDKSGILSDTEGARRRRSLRSPSESGTEADDEGYGLVKALPAPPIRPRKGLRDTRGSGYDSSISPLLTPSLLDDEGRKSSIDYLKSRRRGSPAAGLSPTEDEAKAARQKYLKRRRAELVRRAAETALLGIIAFLAVQGCSCWSQLLRWHRGKAGNIPLLCNHILTNISRTTHSDHGFCGLVRLVPIQTSILF